MEFRILSCIFLVCLLQDVRSESLNELVFRMREVKTAEEFLDSMVRDENGQKIDLDEQEHQFTESGEGVLASGDAVPLATMDFCRARNTTYKFPKDDDPNIVYFPECIVTELCGGCCNGGDLLRCKATRNETIYVKALAVKYSYTGATNFRYVGFKKFAVEKHLACAPACVEESTDCHPIKHTYRPDQCRCVCRLEYEQTCATNKRFDSKTCDCVCKEKKRCGTESVFNTNTCQCESGLYASGVGSAGGPRRSTTTHPTTTEQCAGRPPCPDTWRRVVIGQNMCGCAPTIRFNVGRK